MENGNFGGFYLIVEPVEVVEGLDVLPGDGEPESLAQHLVLVPSSEKALDFLLHFLPEGEGKFLLFLTPNPQGFNPKFILSSLNSLKTGMGQVYSLPLEG